MLKSQVLVPTVCFVLADLLLVPGSISSSLGLALLLDFAAVALITAANPPIQAARLDIRPSALMARAASGQTAIRSLPQATAPTLFGALTGRVAGIVPNQAPIGTRPRTPTSHTATGLEVTFLIMLATLIVAGSSSHALAPRTPPTWPPRLRARRRVTDRTETPGEGSLRNAAETRYRPSFKVPAFWRLARRGLRRGHVRARHGVGGREVTPFVS